jgi:prevent-host-death family protein
MESIGLFEAKAHLSELVERAGRGERIEITKRGVPVAVLGPLPTRAERSAREVVAHIREVRRENRLGDVSLRELIEEGRL